MVVEKQIGAEGKGKAIISGGKLRLEAGYNGKQGDAGLFIEVSTDELLDLLKGAIPGTIDDMVIELAKQALKAI